MAKKKTKKQELEELTKHLYKINPPNLQYFIETIIPDYYPRLKKIDMKSIADRVFSDFVRITNADENGMVQCITCLKRFFREFASEINNGHYKKRSSYKYRYDICNCHPQCYTCNVVLSGNYRNYYIYMVNTYGEEMERKIREDNSTKKLYDYDMVQWCVDRYNTIKEKKAIIEKNNPHKLILK